MLVKSAELGATVEEMPTMRALITVSIQKALIYVMFGEKDLFRLWGKHSEKICNDSSFTDLSLPVYFYSNIINNKCYQGASNGHT